MNYRIIELYNCIIELFSKFSGAAILNNYDVKWLPFCSIRQKLFVSEQ